MSATRVSITMATLPRLLSVLIVMTIQLSNFADASPLQRQALHRLTPSYDQYRPAASQPGIVGSRFTGSSERDRVVDTIVIRTPRQGTAPSRPTSAEPAIIDETETGAPQSNLPATYENEENDLVPCKARNKTVVIEKKGCDTVRVELKVCSGMCVTQVSSQKRFPYISPVCRSCQPDKDSIQFVRVYQPCRAGKRVRTFELQLPSAQSCKCHRCFSDWALSFPALKRRLPLTSN